MTGKLPLAMTSLALHRWSYTTGLLTNLCTACSCEIYWSDFGNSRKK